MNAFDIIRTILEEDDYADSSDRAQAVIDALKENGYSITLEETASDEIG